MRIASPLSAPGCSLLFSRLFSFGDPAIAVAKNIFPSSSTRHSSVLRLFNSSPYDRLKPLGDLPPGAISSLLFLWKSHSARRLAPFFFRRHLTSASLSASLFFSAQMQPFSQSPVDRQREPVFYILSFRGTLLPPKPGRTWSSRKVSSSP